MTLNNMSLIIDKKTAARIRHIRRSKDLTQVRVAKVLKISQGAYSRMEAGKLSPQIPVTRFLKALKIQGNELFT